MHLGISSYTYSWAVGVPGYPPENPITVSGLLQRAHLLGVRVVQIADNLPLHLLSANELGNLAHEAHELGISLEVGTRGITPEHLLNYLRITQQLASPILRLVVDTADYHPTREEIISILRGLEHGFTAAGITLALENHDRFRACELREIVDELGTWAGVCLDTVNSFGALEGPEVVIDTLAPVTVNLHIKDFAIRRAEHQMGFLIEGRPAGQGRLDIPKLLGKIAASGCDPNAILELWTPPEPSLRATLALEERWAVESIKYLHILGCN